jgi:hypothetical protein
MDSCGARAVLSSVGRSGPAPGADVSPLCWIYLRTSGETGAVFATVGGDVLTLQLAASVRPRLLGHLTAGAPRRSEAGPWASHHARGGTDPGRLGWAMVPRLPRRRTLAPSTRRPATARAAAPKPAWSLGHPSPRRAGRCHAVFVRGDTSIPTARAEVSGPSSPRVQPIQRSAQQERRVPCETRTEATMGMRRAANRYIWVQLMADLLHELAPGPERRPAAA